MRSITCSNCRGTGELESRGRPAKDPTEWIDCLFDYVLLGGPEAARLHHYEEQTIRAVAHRFHIARSLANSDACREEYIRRQDILARFERMLQENVVKRARLMDSWNDLGPDDDLLYVIEDYELSSWNVQGVTEMLNLMEAGSSYAAATEVVRRLAEHHGLLHYPTE